ncbi:MAG TPA: IucA/IucC family protein [Mycobacteriales bacterium]|nr:IucA/IucC family protein [Mycobacteriales bacterium]
MFHPPELTPDTWRRAAAALVAKMLAELSFEQALEPRPVGEGRYRVDIGPVGYEFAGRRVALDSWRLDPDSVTRDGVAADPFVLLTDLHRGWQLDPAVTALTVTELSATLAADAHLLATGRYAAALADLPHLELEGHQTGHPWIFASKGRLGFSASDRHRYAPEARRLHRLPWIAAHVSLATHHGPDVRERELDPRTRQRFTALLAARGVDPETYVWLPVHPWQWDEVVLPLFAQQVAENLIVPLGEGPDEYRAQQSIRTFGNITTPGRLDVKLPLSILNTMVYRGIPTELVRAAPPGTAWVHALRDRDPFLRDECRVVLPGEIAAVAVPHPVFADLPGAPYRYRQLLGAIWREPVAGQLDKHERARTLASLLHVDPAGRAFVAELVARSGLPAADWLRRLFGAVLPPLLHLLYRYGIAFNPHGENAIVVYVGEAPVRLAVKDFVDDLKLLDEDLPEYADLPAEALGVLMRSGPAEMCGSVFKSLLVCHFRYLAPLCAEQLGVLEEEFWGMVRAEVLAYQRRFPELVDRFALFDLLASSFERVCLNRERMLPAGYHDRADRDAHVDVEADPVPNPLHEVTT